MLQHDKHRLGLFTEYTMILKYCFFFFFCQIKTHTGAKLPNSKLHFVITGRQQKAPVKVSAASALPPIYIALCIGIANKETTATICHSFIALFFFMQPLRCSLIIYIFACKTNCWLRLFQDVQSYINTPHLLSAGTHCVFVFFVCFFCINTDLPTHDRLGFKSVEHFHTDVVSLSHDIRFVLTCMF